MILGSHDRSWDSVIQRTMWNHCDVIGIYLPSLNQTVFRRLRHGDECIGSIGELAHHEMLMWSWAGQHGVQHADNRPMNVAK